MVRWGHGDLWYWYASECFDDVWTCGPVVVVENKIYGEVGTC